MKKRERVRRDGAYGRCALYVDPDERVPALGKGVPYLLLGHAVVVAVDLCMLQQLVSLHQRCEFLLREEVVIDAMLLAGAYRSCRGGDGEEDVRVQFAEAREDDILTYAGWAGDHDEERIPAFHVRRSFRLLHEPAPEPDFRAFYHQERWGTDVEDGATRSLPGA